MSNGARRAGEKLSRTVQRTVNRSLGILIGCWVLSRGVAGAEPTASEWNLESGVLWQAGHSTPLSYRLVPTQLSWRSAEFFGRGFSDGSRLVVRHRLTLLATWVQSGPESHYLGVAGSPSVEWWDKTRAWSVFGGAGGGAGVIDSRGVAGGQGQDFTLNWFARAGVEWAHSGRGRLSAGLMFQHLSNGGQTTPNPGIDAVGFTAGYAWRF